MFKSIFQHKLSKKLSINKPKYAIPNYGLLEFSIKALIYKAMDDTINNSGYFEAVEITGTYQLPSTFFFVCFKFSNRNDPRKNP